MSLRDIQVLVVEDDQDTRDLVHRLLEAHRAVVIVAATAPEALELMTTVRPDIVVSDIGLPDMDGYELIRRIRQMDPSIANTPGRSPSPHSPRTRTEPARCVPGSTPTSPSPSSPPSS